MRFISSTGTINSSQWAAAVAAAELREGSPISSDLAHIGNTSQSQPTARPVPDATAHVSAAAAASQLSSVQSSVRCFRPWVVPPEGSMVPAVAAAGTAVDDYELFEPPAKLMMRSIGPAQVPSALYGAAPVISMQPVPLLFNAAVHAHPGLLYLNTIANAQGALGTALIGPAGMQTVSEWNGFCQPWPATTAASNRSDADVLCGRAAAPLTGEQSEGAIAAVLQWKHMSATERARAGSLCRFLKEKGVILVGPKGRVLEAGPIASLEWLMLEDEERDRLLLTRFFLDRQVPWAHYVLADGMLTEDGAAVLIPILRRANLPVPPVAESDEEWTVRVRPRIELWCGLDLRGRPRLGKFVDEASPDKRSTSPQKTKLACIEFHVIRMAFNRGEFSGRKLRLPREYRSLPAFARERNMSPGTLGNYVTASGDFRAQGSSLSKLLPSHMQQTQLAMTDKEWREQVQPLITRWDGLPELGRKSLMEFVMQEMPDMPCTPTHEVQLAALQYRIMMHPNSSEVADGQPPHYPSLAACARALHVPFEALQNYVKRSGNFKSQGQSLSMLLPERLRQRAPQAPATELQVQVQPPIEQR